MGTSTFRSYAVALGAAALSFASVVTATPAHAAASLHVRIEVDLANLSGMGYVGDTMFAGTYTARLTAVGPVACEATGPHTVLVDTQSETGNPATPRTAGTCAGAFSGVVTYSLDWVAVPGTSGHFTRVCTVTLGRAVCSAEGTTLILPELGQ